MLRTTAYQYTLPPIEMDGQFITLREVELHMEQTLSTRSQVEVIVTYGTQLGDVVSSQAPIIFGPARHQQLKVGVRNVLASNAYKIQVKVRSLTTSEAPSMNKMRVGWTDGPPIKVGG